MVKMATSHVDEKDVKAETSPPRGHHDEPESSASSVSLDKDVAIALVGTQAQEIDPVVEKRVLRKIDLFLIPAMIDMDWYTTIKRSSDLPFCLV